MTDRTTDSIVKPKIAGYRRHLLVCIWNLMDILNCRLYTPSSLRCANSYQAKQ